MRSLEDIEADLVAAKRATSATIRAIQRRTDDSNYDELVANHSAAWAIRNALTDERREARNATAAAAPKATESGISGALLPLDQEVCQSVSSKIA